MGLREVAERDLGRIVEDRRGGFGWEIVLTAPDGFASPEPLTGLSQDIAQVIDPDTGQAVSGRLASASLRISTVLAAGYTTLPRGIADSQVKPWRVSFLDINGAGPYEFKVVESNPDRTTGMVVLILEAYKP